MGAILRRVSNLCLPCVARWASGRRILSHITFEHLPVKESPWWASVGALVESLGKLEKFNNLYYISTHFAYLRVSFRSVSSRIYSLLVAACVLYTLFTARTRASRSLVKMAI